MTNTTNAKHFIWEHKYRPSNLDKIIMPDDVRKVLQGFVDDGEFANCLFYSESPGTGKTTTAIALCEMLGVTWLKVNASLDKGIDIIRTKINRFASTSAFDSENTKFKVVIFDEFDRMHPDAIEALKGVFDEFAANTRFILTCNNVYRIPAPIRSRCTTQLNFAFDRKKEKQVKIQIYKRLVDILGQEEVQYDKKTVGHIITDLYPDIRHMINTLQNLSKMGVVDGDAYKMFSTTDLDDLVEVMQQNHPSVDGGFTNIRKFVAERVSGDYQRMLTKLAEKLEPMLTPKTVPEMILIIADYMYKDSFVLNKEINFVACIVEILINCDWKAV